MFLFVELEGFVKLENENMKIFVAGHNGGPIGNGSDVDFCFVVRIRDGSVQGCWVTSIPTATSCNP